MKIHRGYNLIGRLTDLKNMYMICTNEKLQQKKCLCFIIIQWPLLINFAQL
jgi:hypothetical protein